jgi:signal transduction histidine kinase
MFCGRRLDSISLALRLTLWYAGIFAASSALAFVFVYAMAAAFVADRTDGELQQDLDEFATQFAQEGMARLLEELAADTQGDEARKVYFRVWSARGRLLASTNLEAWADLPPHARSSESSIEDDETAATTWEIASHPDGVRTMQRSLAGKAALEMGKSLEEDAALLGELRRGFAFTLMIVLALGGPIGWFLARRALKGIDDMAATAHRIAAGTLQARVPQGAQGDGLHHLASAFNTMLDRIEVLVTGMREMADNLAHDLRSPLARIRARAEFRLREQQAAGPGDDADAAVDTIAECDRLLELVNATLDIAEADAGAARLDMAPVDLAEIVASTGELFQPLAEDGGIACSVQAAAPCVIRGDRRILQRVIANLLDNAIKFTPAAGSVRMELIDRGTQVLVAVRDTGIGIAADDLPRIFDRYYRCDKSRCTQGIGLGLNFARAFVRAHAGDIAVASKPGRGSTFTVTLPRSGEGRR